MANQLQAQLDPDLTHWLWSNSPHPHPPPHLRFLVASFFAIVLMAA